MRDFNICELCSTYVDRAASRCPDCRQHMVLPAQRSIAVWRLGEIQDGVLGPVIAGLRVAFQREVVLQPAYLDERPSARPWKGRSASVFLDQVERRHVRGALSLGITGDNIVPGRDWNFLFGLGREHGAAIISVHRLSQGRVKEEKIAERALKIATHELGHVRGLDHHSYEEETDCVMTGDEAFDSVEELDAGSERFCAGCLRKV